MPPSWLLCKPVTIVWAVGSDGDMLPENVGMPMGNENGHPTYFMMETHYDNPQILSGEVTDPVRLGHRPCQMRPQILSGEARLLRTSIELC